MKTFIALIALAFLFICVVDATYPVCRNILDSERCNTFKRLGQCEDRKVSVLFCRVTCNQCGVLRCDQSQPLGMQNKAISDCQITASSYYDKRYRAWEARLNTDSYGWTPKTQQLAVGSWLEVDLLTVHTIDAIATQGSKYNDEWMTSYTLKYSIDGRFFYNYEGSKVFKGNTDRNTVVKHDLDPPIRVARYIRFLPKTWKSWPSIRMEIYECK